MNLTHLLACGLAVAAGAAEASELEKPVRLQASDKPIDTAIGHAAPFVHDMDGDGKRDLLVGQFRGGYLKVYRNLGTNAKPRFGNPDWFKVGGEKAKVPSG